MISKIKFSSVNFILALLGLIAIVYHSNAQTSYTANTNCYGVANPCEYSGPSVLINEICISPSNHDGSLYSGENFDATLIDGGGEWIELFNPHKCDSIDISGYILGTYNSNGGGTNTVSANGMGYVLPPGSKIPPKGFLVLRGLKSFLPSTNAIDVTVKGTENNMCLAGGSYSRFWFANAGSWFAFYDKNGVIQDAVTWGSPVSDDLNQSPCIPIDNYLPTGVSSLPSYNSFGKGKYLGETEVGYSFVRIPDGGPWSSTLVSESTSMGSCNEFGACQIGKASSTCNGTGSVIPDFGKGPYQYKWDDVFEQETPTATLLCSGIYNVRVTDALGEEKMYQVEVLDDFLKIKSLEVTQPSCPGEVGKISIFLNKAGEYKYNWNPMISSENKAANLLPGTYQVYIEDEWCPIDTTITISSTLLNVAFTVDDELSCEGQTVTFTNHSSGANEGTSTFVWDFGDGNTSVEINPEHTYQKEGTYSVSLEMKTNKGCTQKVNKNQLIDINEMPTVNLGPDQTICANKEITLDAGNNFVKFIWSPGYSKTSTLTTEIEGTYSLMAFDENGCAAYDEMELKFTPEIIINLGNDTAFCEGNSLVINVPMQSHPLVWSTGDVQNNIEVSLSGMYFATITDDYNCTYSDTVVVDVVAYPEPIQILADSISCIGDTLLIHAQTNAQNIAWQDGTLGSDFVATNDGVYTVIASNSSMSAVCSIEDSLQVKFYPYPENKPANDFAFCFEWGESLMISTPIAAEYYIWEDNRSNDSTYVVWHEGDYLLSSYNYIHCPVNQTIHVEEKCPIRVYVPNAFTPEGDGLNEYFFPVLVNEIDFEFVIFNRWGEEIFQTTSKEKTWDGTYLGRPVPIGVYVWKLIANGYNEDIRKTQIEQIGTVTLIR